MTNLERVEKLRERANVSYSEAKEALEAANGDLLDALVHLEKQGLVHPPWGDGYYTSERVALSSTYEDFKKEEQRSKSGRNFSEALERLWRFCAQLINKANNTNFEVLKEQESMAKFPVTVLALLVIFLPWITLPLIIIGLLFDFHYRFVSVDSDGDIWIWAGLPAL